MTTRSVNDFPVPISNPQNYDYPFSKNRKAELAVTHQRLVYQLSVVDIVTDMFTHEVKHILWLSHINTHSGVIMRSMFLSPACVVERIENEISATVHADSRIMVQVMGLLQNVNVVYSPSCYHSALSTLQTQRPTGSSTIILGRGTTNKRTAVLSYFAPGLSSPGKELHRILSNTVAMAELLESQKPTMADELSRSAKHDSRIRRKG